MTIRLTQKTHKTSLKINHLALVCGYFDSEIQFRCNGTQLIELKPKFIHCFYRHSINSIQRTSTFDHRYSNQCITYICSDWISVHQSERLFYACGSLFFENSSKIIIDMKMITLKLVSWFDFVDRWCWLLRLMHWK